MAIITNYATLKTAIADYLARDDLTTFIPNFVQNTENKLRRTLNLRNEETALSVAVSSGTGTVPTDFKALKLAYVPDSPSELLKWVPLEEIYRAYPTRSGSNTPVLISREGANFVFGPYAKDFTLTGIYYAKPDSLEDTDPSWYVTNAPELLLYGSLMESAPFIHGDERLPVWQQLFTDALQTLRDEQNAAETSMGNLTQRVS
jgi:hypothetical protein